MSEQGARFERATQQPWQVDIKIADDIFVKSILIPRANTFIPQHAHTYDHLSMLAVGTVEVWKNGKAFGVFTAPSGILIEANAKHTFKSLTDNVLLYCIHNVARTGEVDVAEEHQIVGERVG